MIGWLAESLAAGEKIELRGLGTFGLKRAAGKKYPSLLSGGKVLPAHGRVVFHPCEKLRRAVWNRGGE
jgi:nucleoid DNA-binding protein